jgi:hypothetical protein
MRTRHGIKLCKALFSIGLEKVAPGVLRNNKIYREPRRF